MLQCGLRSFCHIHLNPRSKCWSLAHGLTLYHSSGIFSSSGMIHNIIKSPTIWRTCPPLLAFCSFSGRIHSAFFPSIQILSFIHWCEKGKPFHFQGQSHASGCFWLFWVLQLGWGNREAGCVPQKSTVKLWAWRSNLRTGSGSVLQEVIKHRVSQRTETQAWEAVHRGVLWASEAQETMH